MTTSAKRKESRQRITEDKYFNLIEHAADGIAIIQNGVFKLVNTALTRISGYSKRELLGTPFTKLLIPESQEVTLARYKARLAGEKVPPVYEVKAITKSGEILDIEINAALTEYDGLVADEVIIRDVTERKKTEEKLQTILTTALDGFWLTNLKGKLLKVNDSYCKMVGYTQEELQNMYISDLETAESQKKVAEHIKRIIKKGYDRFESRHKRKDGKIIDVEISVNYLNVGEGQLFVFARDISERKLAEQALTDEATRRRILIDQSRDGIVVLDQNGKVYEANKRFAEMLGYTPEETAELHMWDWDTQWSREQLLGMVRGVDEAGDHFETYHRRKDGTTIDVEISTNGAIFAGQKLVFCVCRNITERKLAEDKLRESEQKYRTIFENVSDTIIRLDKHGRIVDVNQRAEECFGHKPEEVIGKSFTKLGALKIKDLPKMVKIFAKVVRGGHPLKTLELEAKRKDGSAVTIEVNTTRIKNGGETGGTVAIVRDVTERKKADEALRQAKEQFETLQEESPFGVTIIKQDGRYQYLNPKFIEMFGYTLEDIPTGREWFNKAFPDPKLRREIISTWQTDAKLSKRGEVKPLIYTVKCKDSSEKVIQFRPISLENGDYFVIYEDITERKKAEQALADEATRRRILVDQSLDGIVVLDGESKVYEANQKFAEMLGYTMEEVRELHTWDWDTQWSREELLEMGHKVDETGYRLETKHRRKDGSTIDVDISINGAVVAGQKLIFCVCRNITERKKAEQLQQGENYVLTLLGQGADLSQLLDAIVHLGEQNDPSIKGSVMLLDPSKELLSLASAPSLPDDYKKLFENSVPVGPKAGSCGTTAYLKERVVVPDIAKDPLFKPFKEVIKRSINNGLLAVWSQPIIGSDGELLGTIANYSNRVGEPSADNLRVLEWSARIAAIAIERKQAEEALQAEKNKLQSVIGAIEYDLTIQDRDFNVIYQNEASRISSGGDQMGKKCYWSYEGRDKICDGCPVEKAFKDGKSHTTERKRIMPSGEVTLWENTANPIRDAQGNIVSCLEIGRNITERKKMEQQLQENNEQLDAQNEELKAINEELRATEEELQKSQERLERMFESVTDGIVVTGTDGSILIVNQGAVQMHGFTTEEELLGKNSLDLIAPRDRSRVKRQMLNAQEKGATRFQECNLIKADGSDFPAELNTSALKDASGTLIGHITIARDITSRKQMEKLFQMVTNSSQVGIYIVQDRRFMMSNPKFQSLTGYSEDELRGIEPLSLVLDEDQDRVREEAIRMLKGQRTSPYQFRVVNKGGEIRWVMETVTSITYQGRRATLGNYMDITERRQVEEREKQLEQELNLASRLASIGQLAAGVAHEINNPLTGVIGFSHLILSQDIPDDIKQDLQIIHSEAQRVARIVENLLVFAHQRKTGRESVNVNETVTKILELRSYEMKVNNIEVETHLDPEIPPTMADPGQLQQVFLNIVLNAEYFMIKSHSKGKLVVKTEKIDGSIRVSFTDNGTGISPENLDKIFNPFFTTKEVGKGTGLGLSICHSIITQHDGRIYAESKPGKGATFFIELPVVDQPAQGEKIEKRSKETLKPQGAKILVVDDEQAILDFLSRLLTEWGHTVETINNADAALERLKTERYSLVLLDIKLPGMSGIELYRHIEKTVPALTRRVMFVTGDVMESATRDFLEKSGAAHITKPIDIETLKKMITSTLNQTQLAPVTSG